MKESTEEDGRDPRQPEEQGCSSQLRSDSWTASNVGLKLLKKSGWKEGTGLGVSEQGMLEPLDIIMKRDKRGIGASKPKLQIKSNKTLKSKTQPDVTGNRKPLVSKKASKRLKKELEKEQKLEEQSFQRDFFMQFWPDNV